jgi:V8-like Glu-specific endopeptidase
MAVLEITCPDGSILNFDENDYPVVRFGRDPNWAHVVLGDEFAAKGVSREHVELKANPGCYELEMSGKNMVWVNDRKAYDKQNLDRECELSLVKGDPTTTYKLRVKLLGTVITEDVGHKVGGRHDGAIKGIILGGVGLTILVAGGWYFQKEKRLSDEQIRYISKRVVSIQAEGVGRISHTGTAWFAGDNKFITNRHVADYISQSQRMGDHVYIRLRSQINQDGEIQFGEIKEIKLVVSHPGEKLFAEFRYTHPVRLQAQNTLRLDVYDAAIIEIEGDQLSLDPLKIADDDDIKSLKYGDKLYIAGFPLNQGGKETWTMKMPDAAIRDGSFEKTRNYYGPIGNKEINPLMSYAIETAGGNSGSPILNTDGEVVALHFAGTKMLVQGIEKEILVGGSNSYGQNARLVKQFIDGSIIDGKYTQEALKKETEVWNKWINSMPSVESATVAQLDGGLTAPNKCVLKIREPWKTTNLRGSKIRRIENMKIPLPTSGHYAVFLQSFDPSGFRLDVSTGDLQHRLSASMKKHHFEFEFDNSAGNPSFNLTMGGPNGDSDYSIIVYTWGAEACDSQGYQKR